MRDIHSERTNPPGHPRTGRKERTLGTVLLLIFLASGGCRYHRLEQRLDPVNKEWLTRVGYIITSEERKLFLDLPKSDKEQFKREFWARRDPDPGTEENEFKMTYEARIESADDMFRSEPRQGYLTDRGRIFVLFGPPQYRTSATRSEAGVRQEIWYYGNFPVIFVDEYGTGTYELITYNLSSLRSTNLLYMHELSRAQDEARKTIRSNEQMFNFSIQVDSIQALPERIEFRVVIQIPVASLWFEARGRELVSTWEISLAVKDDQDIVAWEYLDIHEFRTDEDELVHHAENTYKIRIPVKITDGLDTLRRGEIRIFAELNEKTGDRRLQKIHTFRIEEALLWTAKRLRPPG